jgi:O-succinylbenzoic acid--CoA ligase
MPAPPRLVGVPLPPGPGFVRALEAAWDRGDAVLPLDPIAPPASRDALAAALRVGEDIEPGTALVIATSGSTGDPKGARLTHDALAASATATYERIGRQPGDAWLSCLPWHHIGGLQVLLRSRLARIPITVHESFDVDAVATADATLVSLVPTQLVRLLDAGADLGRFRAILLGGAAAPTALLQRAADAGANVVTTYGMSETAGGCVYDGLALAGVDVRIEPDGRIAITGPTLMAGYRTVTQIGDGLVDGWFVTTDIGEIVDGRLVVAGRMDDVIVTGGEKVAALAVADVLARHPAVSEALVVGVGDREWGQRVVALLVAAPGSALPGDESLRAWCRERLPAAAVPRQVVPVDALPRLASGKPDRRTATELAARLAG